jgi:peptide chain release factor subunit 3
LAVYGEQDDELKSATCGDNIRLRLKGVEEEEVHRGFVLCDSVKPVHTVQAFEAQLMILEHKNIICAGYTAVMHVHTVVEEISVGVCLLNLLCVTFNNHLGPATFN